MEVRYEGQCVGGPMSGQRLVWSSPQKTIFELRGSKYEMSDGAEAEIGAIGSYDYDEHFGQWTWTDYVREKKNPNNKLPFLMPPDLMGDVADFHNKFGLGYDGPSRDLPIDHAQFRVGFMAEELFEFVGLPEGLSAAMTQTLKSRVKPGDLEKKLDALVDLVYVAIGTAYLYGFDFREAWRRVHAANMAKVRCERDSDSARSDGAKFDVVKPPGWQKPVLSDLVEPNR
jgi:predicted HAD superfamily Cof-like phosphohydrolase